MLQYLRKVRASFNGGLIINPGPVSTHEIKIEFSGHLTFSIIDPDGYFLTITKTLEALSPEQAMERAAQNGV